MTRSIHNQYGKALYEVAVKNGAAERILNDLDALAHISRDQNFLELIKKAAYLPKETIKKLLVKVFGGQIDNSVLNLIILLIFKRHFQRLPKIFDAFKKAYYKAKGIIEIKVCMARKFGMDTENHILEALQKQVTGAVRISFEEDSALIGGMQFYERGYLTDYSIKNYLDNLGKQLLKAPHV